MGAGQGMTDLASTRPESFFSDRFNINAGLMERVLGGNLVGKVDDADIYLEYRINEELLLEEGTVKKASRHVSQGAGVRAQSGTRTGYAHTDEISIKNLDEAARQARDRLVRRWRARDLRLLPRGGTLAPVRRRGCAPGGAEAPRGRRAGRHDDRGARSGLARHPAPRGDRPRARRRLQSQGDVGVLGPPGATGRLGAGDGGRRRDDPEPPRLAQRRRRGHADRPDRADRE